MKSESVRFKVGCKFVRRKHIIKRGISQAIPWEFFAENVKKFAGKLGVCGSSLLDAPNNSPFRSFHHQQKRFSMPCCTAETQRAMLDVSNIPTGPLFGGPDPHSSEEDREEFWENVNGALFPESSVGKHPRD